MGIGHVNNIFGSDVDWGDPSTRYAAMCLAYHADRKGVVRISQKELAEEMLTSPRTLARHIEDLCDLGVIKRLGHGRYGLVYGAPGNSRGQRQAQPTQGRQEPLWPGTNWSQEEYDYWQNICENDPDYEMRYDDRGVPSVWCKGIGRVA